MRFRCYGCSESVSSEVPDDAILRAVAWCPECIEAGKDQDSEALATARREERERCAAIPPPVLVGIPEPIHQHQYNFNRIWAAYAAAIRALGEE